jgi:TonB family protein
MIALLAAAPEQQPRPGPPPPPPIRTPAPPQMIPVPPPYVTRTYSPPQPATPPRQIGGAVSSDDYPASALRAGAEGEVGAIINVGVNGRVEACTIERSSGNAALDAATCSLIQRRFRYEPATQDGQPVAAVVRRNVYWGLEPDEVIQFGPGQLTWTQAAINGQLSGCQFTPVGLPFSLMGQRCARGASGLIVTDLLPKNSRLNVVAVLTLTPEGEVEAPVRQAGRLDHVISAAIEVGPRGQILRCRETERSGTLPPYVRPLLTDFCEALGQEKRIGFPTGPRDPRPVRKAVLRQMVFVDF